MEVHVIKFQMKPSPYRMGHLIVGYYDLQMDMDLVLYEPQQKLWIRMPEIWDGKFKKRYCFWPSQKISDRFQERILTILTEKYGVTFEKTYELFKNRKRDKNPVHQTTK